MKTAEEVAQMKEDAAEEKAEAVVTTAILKRATVNEKNNADALKEVARGDSDGRSSQAVANAAALKPKAAAKMVLAQQKEKAPKANLTDKQEKDKPARIKALLDVAKKAQLKAEVEQKIADKMTAATGAKTKG
eukprot:g3894.t1